MAHIASPCGCHLNATDSPEMVARGLLNAPGRQALVRPGLLSKLLQPALTFLPRRGRAWMMGKVMSGMAGRRHAA